MVIEDFIKECRTCKYDLEDVTARQASEVADQIEELLKDKKRLDILEKNSQWFNRAIEIDHNCSLYGDAQDLRTAIDKGDW